MKICSLCKIEKDLEEFGIDKARKDGRNLWCKECKNKRNRERYKGYNKKYHQERKVRYYGILYDYISKADMPNIPTCTLCGYQNELWAPFDWHHVHPKSKEYEVSSMVRHTEEKIIDELDKCVLLCSNCHRVHHYEERLDEIN